jgi:hypothetical protein
VHVTTHQKTVIFNSIGVIASFYAYVQAVSCGIEHSSGCKKAVEYFILFVTSGEECMEKEIYGLL